MKRFFSFLLCLTLCAGWWAAPALAAPSWPTDTEISAEGGILIDAASGTILYGKNIHETYYPASITKILTALIVIENCSLDETVTFSHTAVYDVEAGSSSAGLDVGDELSVRDCLYAMLLKSANEAANALAEHTAGSIEAFADMMNEKAASLGCTDSHFANPSGLNNPEHYTSAYDMTQIARAAFENETFVTIDSTLYYDLPSTRRSPDGSRIYPGHKMLKKNLAEYYPGIVGGKTGYTSLAGNTLVTCAERNDMRLITVVLNGHQTHYTDTKTLLDFGFSNFRSLRIADADTAYASVANDMTISGLPAANLSILYISEDSRITLPISADITDATSAITYELPEGAPERAVARISYDYDGRTVGEAWLMRRSADELAEEIPDVMDETIPTDEILPAEETNSAGEALPAGETETGNEAFSSGETGTTVGTSLSEESAENGDVENSTDPDSPNPVIALLARIPRPVWIAAAAILIASAVIGGGIYFRYRTEKQEADDRELRYRRRQERLHDIGISTADFDLLLQKKRSESLLKKDKSAKRPRRHPSFLDHKKLGEDIIHAEQQLQDLPPAAPSVYYDKTNETSQDQ
ncbi:MAG: D-alanyl-D-alanine carboxypeptidase [Clostridiales bacterium]|nr:D-alanyl-D-alanine carboxypeptidase [Clostridiales bacterium]